MPATSRPKRAAKTPVKTPVKKAAAAPAGNRLIPPKGGATVRMYRTGHGDCFLLAFEGKTRNAPVYVLIDCGYKPGSPKHINTTIGEITQSMREATGGHIDVAVITHEHQDHVNGITEGNFEGISIGQTWCAWTENPDDDLADQLRKTYRDKLLGLLAARQKLAAAGGSDLLQRIDDFLAFELGGEVDPSAGANAGNSFAAAAKDPGASKNKASMKLLKNRAERGVEFIYPHKIQAIDGTKDVRVFALGPPRDAELLRDLDPQGGEEFHRLGMASHSAVNYLAAAARGDAGTAPFLRRCGIADDQAFADPAYGQFFTEHYGSTATAASTSAPDKDEVPDDAPWRRIDTDWLYSAEQLAIDLNDETNNSSLVLAFELGRGGKVLLFAADAQRGNWISWSRKEWNDGGQRVTARDLLRRTVLYKVGHHGSHNATLNGDLGDDYPNISWMATDDYGREFCAMITAVRSWAETQKGWDHPLKAIKEALLKKAAGRVFQTDTDVAKMTMPSGASKTDWTSFQSRTRGDRLFFDYSIVP